MWGEPLCFSFLVYQPPTKTQMNRFFNNCFGLLLYVLITFGAGFLFCADWRPLWLDDMLYDIFYIPMSILGGTVGYGAIIVIAFAIVGAVTGLYRLFR